MCLVTSHQGLTRPMGVVEAPSVQWPPEACDSCEPSISSINKWIYNIIIIIINPLMPTIAIWVPLSILCQTGHSDARPWASECPDAKNYKWRLNPVWHRMLYSSTHMATVDPKKGLLNCELLYAEFYRLDMYPETEPSCQIMKVLSKHICEIRKHCSDYSTLSNSS